MDAVAAGLNSGGADVSGQGLNSGGAGTSSRGVDAGAVGVSSSNWAGLPSPAGGFKESRFEEVAVAAAEALDFPAPQLAHIWT